MFAAFLDPGALWAGLSFSLPLILILLAHELGHYCACLYYDLDATLPYFLPVPTFIGTMVIYPDPLDHLLAADFV